MRFKKVLKRSFALFLVITMLMTSFAYADEDDFDGWDDEKIESVEEVMEMTDWSEIEQYLILSEVDMSTAEAVDLSNAVKGHEKDVRKFLTEEKDYYGKAADTWTALMLACIQVLTNGKPPSKDITNAHEWHKGLSKKKKWKITKEESLAALYNRLLSAQSILIHKKTELNLYKKDDYLKSMIQSVVMTHNYSSQYPQYDPAGADKFKKDKKNKFYFPDKYDPPSDFAIKVCEHYKCISATSTLSSGQRETIVAAAYSQIGTPYVWGGTTPNVALDCSGLTSYCYRCAGITIPRTSGAQREQGTVTKTPLPGDICWTPGHVAIYIGDGKMIEAQQTGVPVKISPVRVTDYVTFVTDSGGYAGGMSGPASEMAKKVVNAAMSKNTYGLTDPNWCSKWVRLCYYHVGVMSYTNLPEHGTALSSWHSFNNVASKARCSTDRTNIPVGAAVFGTGSGSGGAGHVGIHLGNGKIADYARGAVRIQEINYWLSWQKDVIGGQQGFVGWVLPYECL